MIRVPKSIPAAQLTTSAAIYYTTPIGTYATISNLSLTNTSGSPVSVSVYNVPSAGTASAANAVVSGYSLSSGQTYVPPQLIGLTISPNSTIQALAATGAVVNVQGGVYETSGS